MQITQRELRAEITLLILPKQQCSFTPTPKSWSCHPPWEVSAIAEYPQTEMRTIGSADGIPGRHTWFGEYLADSASI